MQKLLGRRNVMAIQVYIKLDEAVFGEANDEYQCKITETVGEAVKLISVGYSTFQPWRSPNLQKGNEKEEVFVKKIGVFIKSGLS